MRKTIIPILFALLAMPSFAADDNPRIVSSLNFGWQFHAGDIVNGEAVGLDDASWQTVNVPHDFLIHQPWVAPGKDERADNSDAGANVKSRLSARGFKEMGIGWYRKTITPDASWRGKRVVIDFEGIMLVGDVYFNGKHIGQTDYGYLGFDADVTSLVKWGEPNVIAVKANTMNTNNSRWYTGAGLYRDVNLIVTDARQHFTRHPLYITTPEVNANKSIVKIQAEINCQLKERTITVSTVIVDADNDTVYTSKKALPFNRRQKTNEYLVDSFAIDQPRLWSCETPHLYKAIVSIHNNDGSLADQVTETFGVRKIEFSPEYGFKLNGKKVLLKGNANHHTLGALGAAVYPRAMEKRIQMLKEFGFNHIRTAHNPYSESFLDLCDKYGILVVDELYDKWLKQYAGGREDWMNLWQRDVPEWVKRDRNHPSVIMWSLGNELQQYWELPFADWGVTPYRLQKELLKRYDNTRLVTVAMHPRYRDLATDSLPAPLVLETDVASYNYRYMYFPGDSKRFPWMIFYQSEANTSGMGPNFFEMNLDKVIGLAYWGMIDYFGESHGWPAKGWAQGVFDISLEPKPNAYFLKSFYKDDEPLVHIGVLESEKNTMWNDVQMSSLGMSDHWNRIPGSTMSLYTYTNADEVELVINGKSIGKKLNDKKNPKVRNKIKWDNVKYEAGYIEAIARTNGKIVARHKVETTKDATKLSAAGDNANWKADGMDLQHVKVCAVDKKGRWVKTAHNEVKFTVTGPAEIVGVINGNINSHELTVGDTRRLYNGTCTVILRSKQDAGDVVLTATTDGLKKATVKFKTQQ